MKWLLTLNNHTYDDGQMLLPGEKKSTGLNAPKGSDDEGQEDKIGGDSAKNEANIENQKNGNEGPDNQIVNEGHRDSRDMSSLLEKSKQKDVVKEVVDQTLVCDKNVLNESLADKLDSNLIKPVEIDAQQPGGDQKNS